MRISEVIVKWYHENKRDLPWRKTESPYHIWLSEIILQQTRVIQGLEYYRRFIGKYPSVTDLAEAPIDEVLKLWQGLGYYTRARNLHLTARKIAFDLKGRFPRKYEELLKLRGIGPYTAAAVASIAFKEPVALVDGNVSRVLSRVFGIHSPIDSPEGKRIFEQRAAEILDRAIPDIHNQALMEFGALVCLPKKPDCANCVMAQVCIAYSEGKTGILPVKTGRIKPRKRYYNYLFIRYNDFTYLNRRNGKDIWNSLYELPLIESPASWSYKNLISSPGWKNLFGNREAKADPHPKKYKHQLTHQTLFCTFYYINIDFKPDSQGFNFLQVPLKRISKYAVPRIIDKYLTDLNQEGIL